MRYALWFRSMALCIILALAIPLQAFSQDEKGDQSRQQAQQRRFSQEELARLLAPIALYPDALLSQVLMASTYPLEVVAADRWVDQNKALKGDDLAKALEEQTWDPSVKSLVNFPTVLSMMSRKLEITAELGDAFLVQEKEVMETVQMLRRKALEAGNLKSTKEQKVVVEQEAVIIEPVEREVVYVPTYDPLYVYGPWFYPAYPPYPYYYYPPPPYYYVGFATAITLGFAWGYAWGGCNWHHHNVYVDVHRPYYVTNRYINRDRYVRYYERRGVIGRDGYGRWRHDPAHRRGVAYRDAGTAERFGQSPARVQRSRDIRGGVEDRSRGRVDRAVRQPAGRPGIEQKGRPAPTRGQGVQPPSREQRGSAVGEQKGGRERLPTGVSGQVAPKRESVFSGVQRDGSAARSASERGRSSREWSGGGRSGSFGGGVRFEGSGGRSGGWPGGGTGVRGGGGTGGGTGGRGGGGRGGGGTGGGRR